MWKMYGPVLLATGASQTLMAASTLLFWTLGVDGADLYTVGIQVGNLSYTGFVLGVLYLVVLGRPNFQHWKLSGIAAITVSLLGSVSGFFVVAAGNTSHTPADLVTIMIFSIGGAALALQGVKFVRVACSGKPNKLAGATLIPNAALLLGLLAVEVFRLPGDWSITLPAFLWMLSCFVLLLDRKPVIGEHSTLGPLDQNKGQLSHFLILGVGLFTSNFMPFLYMHFVSGLPSGTIAFGFLLIRITSSAIYLISSSFLSVRLNWINAKLTKGKYEVQAVLGLTIMTFACLALAKINLQALALTAATLSLAVGLFVSSTLLRELSFMKKNKTLLAKVVLDLAISCCAAYVLFLNPSVLGLITVYIVSHVITIIISSWGLGFRKISIISLLPLTACFLILSGV